MPPVTATIRHCKLRTNLLPNRVFGLLLFCAVSLAALPSAVAQQSQPAAPASASPGAAAAAPSPALALYHQLRSVGLDEQKIFHVRDGDLDREDIHLSLTEGTIAFTREVDGHVTGAVFEGDGEILVVPPNQTERASLALFTHAAVLEEKFSTVYLRFNDNTYA